MKAPVSFSPPRTDDELLDRASQLAGHPLAAIAQALGDEVPESQRRAKGWVGQIVERALGATGSNIAGPDFQDLGVELKAHHRGFYLRILILDDKEDADLSVEDLLDHLDAASPSSAEAALETAPLWLYCAAPPLCTCSRYRRFRPVQRRAQGRGQAA